MENNQTFEIAITKVQKAIEQENQSESNRHDIDPEFESVINDEEEKQSTTDYDSPFDKIMEIENVFALKQGVFQKSETTTFIEDTFNLCQPITTELDRQLSEASCY
ncbi:unnamed protein product [Rotaria sp. Silwood2]|nr:unnamed protein product [Rotaria sp. Silwood2]CAF4108561.1 unnamed protein product [Rotaria sp. Silwood2]